MKIETNFLFCGIRELVRLVICKVPGRSESYRVVIRAQSYLDKLQRFLDINKMNFNEDQV